MTKHKKNVYIDLVYIIWIASMKQHMNSMQKVKEKFTSSVMKKLVMGSTLALAVAVWWMNSCSSDSKIQQQLEQLVAGKHYPINILRDKGEIQISYATDAVQSILTVSSSEKRESDIVLPYVFSVRQWDEIIERSGVLNYSSVEALQMQLNDLYTNVYGDDVHVPMNVNNILHSLECINLAKEYHISCEDGMVKFWDEQNFNEGNTRVYAYSITQQEDGMYVVSWTSSANLFSGGEMKLLYKAKTIDELLDQLEDHHYNDIVEKWYQSWGEELTEMMLEDGNVRKSIEKKYKAVKDVCHAYWQQEIIQ